MKDFRITTLVGLVLPFLIWGCDPMDLHLTGPPTNIAWQDQFNAIQGQAIEGNIFDNDELNVIPYELEKNPLVTRQGFTVRIRSTGHFSYAPPLEYFGRDTTQYVLLTLRDGQVGYQSRVSVYLSIIEADRTGFMVDPRDGQQYPTILMDDGQVWMAENLNINLEGSTWFEEKAANGALYGRLYPWSVARYACPEGWHLPSREEVVTILQQNKGPETFAGIPIDKNYLALFEGGYTGLNLLVGGIREPSGNYRRLDRNPIYWTSSMDQDSSLAFSFELTSSSPHVLPRDTTFAYACRCIKNAD